MADSKVSGLTATTAILDADMFYIVKAADLTKGYKITGTNLLSQIGSKDAWVPLQVSGTYVDGGTFTVSGDYTSVIGIGDKLKLTNSTVKYFVVRACSYSSPNTTVTVTGGSTYALTNTTISPVYYSHTNAVGFPVTLALTAPTMTTTGTGFTNQPTTNSWKFATADRICTVTGVLQNHATSGGTGVFIATFTAGQLPPILGDAVGSAYNMSNSKAGYCYVSATDGVIKMALYDGNTIAGNSEYYIVTISFFIG